MNPVLILSHNNLELTKRCVDSVQKQDIPTRVFIIDNGSTDGTVKWAQHNRCLLDYSIVNRGVSVGWNHGLKRLFESQGVEYVLVIGNDTVLGEWAYRWLVSLNLPFVTGVAVDKMEQVIEPGSIATTLEDHPDFSCFLIRHSVWEKVGPFDESMKLYASDCDFHIRAHQQGINLYKACVPFYHERSSTLRLAVPEERVKIEEMANKDRAVFQKKHGFLPGSAEYEAMFK